MSKEEESSPDLPAPAEIRLPVASTEERGLVPQDSLQRYFAELAKYPPISREEEHELAIKMVEEGDLDAARKITVSNLRLVVKIAMEYRRAWTNVLDLVQEGNTGLLEAVKRYDPYQEVRVSTYASYWIRAYILKYIIDNIRMVRVGSSRAQRKLFYRLNKEKQELEKLGFDVTPALLAERLEVTENDVIEMEQRLEESDLSFDAPIRHDETRSTFGDLIAGEGASSEDIIAQQQIREIFQEQIQAFILTLEERDRKILEERSISEDPKTLAELGEELGLTRERVRQLEARLIKKLRQFFQEKLVDFEYHLPGQGEDL